MNIFLFILFAFIYYFIITVLFHEFSHYFIAKILGFKITGFTILPRIDGKDLISGTVSFKYPLDATNIKLKLIFTFIAPIILSTLIILLCFYSYNFLNPVILFIVQFIESCGIIEFILSMICYKSFEGYDGSKIIHLIKSENING